MKVVPKPKKLTGDGCARKGSTCVEYYLVQHKKLEKANHKRGTSEAASRVLWNERGFPSNDFVLFLASIQATKIHGEAKKS